MQGPKYNLTISSADEPHLCSNNMTEVQLMTKMSEVFGPFYIGFVGLWEITKSESNGVIEKMSCDCDTMGENGEVTIYGITIFKV